MKFDAGADRAFDQASGRSDAWRGLVLRAGGAGQ
jgi:hypothetical protein